MSLPEAAAVLPLQRELRAISNLSILGAGSDGTWLAQLAAGSGYRVVLEDLMPGKRRLAARQLANYPQAVTYASSVEEAAREADLVIDFVPDELESKLEIFSLLDRMAPPHTIFATPTRTLSIADLASCTYRAERCVALRLSPGMVAGEPLFVEVLHAPGALTEVVAAVVAFWTSLGAEVTTAIDQAPLP